ncbi:Copper amine oxidase N-terminal domain-containing protein [Paenibacillus tianmuensis]|uniref:Copper amine oxidase N-terminal domain-containing protein n=1 Tax=Paenibacillus tianmuensis TaxID=624147 RepID=A0A1G4S5V5_9BACL|nr:copper amine oxidase N-terminal domain-containing protein [Paenibacillus tianmuensis]SCW64418.1 Copper amine oxidase N-terminal domain-containing protein [Paenibacillus tianmuensis]
MKPFKVLGTVLAGALLATNVVSAAPGESATVKPLPISAPAPQDSYGGLKFVLVIDGKGFSPEENPIYVGAKNQIMVPIRAAAEALGYKLTWKQDTQSLELVQGNQWLTLQIGQDKYSFAKMLVPLEAAPELTNEKTYVPLSYFEKVMKLQVKVNATGTITIHSKKQESEEQVLNTTKQGTITSITYRDKGGEIGLNGYGHGVRLNISGETEIVSDNNQKLTLADLQLGVFIEAEHGLAMAMSMPPMTHAKKIIVKQSSAAQQTLGTAGEIEEITSSAEGTTRLTIKGNKLSDGSHDTVVLNVAGDTPVIGTKDNQPVAADQLKKGDKVYAFYGPILTKSLPPIGQAVKIVVEN